MKIVITSHNLKATEAIEERVNTHLGKLDRLIPGIVSARVKLENDTAKLHIPCSCSIRLEIPGNDLIAEDAQSDMYQAVDNVVKKLRQQAEKKHNKSKAINKGNANTCEVEQMIKGKTE